MGYVASSLIDLLPDGTRKARGAYGYLGYYYEQLISQGLLQHAFYDGSAITFIAFEQLASSESVAFLLIFDEHENGPPIAHCHLTGMQGYCVMAHFCILRGYHDKSYAIMRDTIRSIFSVFRSDGTPFATTLMGLTPMYNRAARKAIKAVGFESIAVIEDACYLHYKDKFCDGELTLLTAKSFF